MIKDKQYDDEFFQKHVKLVVKDVCVTTGKLCFYSKTEAKKKRQEKELKYLKKYKIYTCIFCNTLHLSTVDTDKERNDYSEITNFHV